MPSLKQRWENTKKIFNLTLLKIELKKRNPSGKKIYTLIKEMCIKEESIPFDLFSDHKTIITEVLEKILTLPSKMEIRFYSYKENDLAIKPNEIAFMLFKRCKKFTQYYYVDGSSPNKHYIFETPGRKVYLAYEVVEAALRKRGILLINTPIIRHANRQLEDFYFKLANDAFRQFRNLDQVCQLEVALEHCLYLHSDEDGKNFNTTFKTLITELYFADKKEELKEIPPLIFSHLKTSHYNAKETYEFLKTEKNKRAGLNAR